MKRQRNSIFTALVLFFFGAISIVNASDLEIPENYKTVDFSKKGSIKITLEEKESNQGISGAELSLYHVANASEKDNNLVFYYVEGLETCDADLSNLEADNLTGNIKKCLSEDTASTKKITDTNGIVKYNDLTLGLYLVKQTNKVEGYSSIDEFLVMIPKTIDNNWTYNIEAEPKTEIYQTIDLQVVKEWNKQNKNNKLPESVTIELLKDEEIIDTVALSELNNWTYTWDDIEKSDKYSVRETNIPKGYTATYKNEEYKFIVTNTDKLAQTGQIYLPIIILSATGMLFIILGIIELKKNENEE